MTKPSYDASTNELIAELKAAGKQFKVDGYGVVYVKSYEGGHAAWVKVS